MNKQWHATHPMPQRPTFDQRVAWHRAHAENCGCREMPKAVREALERGRVEAGTGSDAARGEAGRD
jgi:hypothetical protein